MHDHKFSLQLLPYDGVLGFSLRFVGSQPSTDTQEQASSAQEMDIDANSRLPSGEAAINVGTLPCKFAI